MRHDTQHWADSYLQYRDVYFLHTIIIDAQRPERGLQRQQSTPIKEVHHTAGCLLPLVLCPDSILKLKMASGYWKRRRPLIHPGFIAAGCTVFQMIRGWQNFADGHRKNKREMLLIWPKGEDAINHGPALHLGLAENCKFIGCAVGTTRSGSYNPDWSCS